MIFDRKIKACFTYAKEHDLTTYEKGSYKINGDEFLLISKTMLQ